MSETRTTCFALLDRLDDLLQGEVGQAVDTDEAMRVVAEILRAHADDDYFDDDLIRIVTRRLLRLANS